MPVIFGLDPSLRSTGYGVIRAEGRELRVVAYGVIQNHDKLVPSRCLEAIHREVAALLAQHKPDAAAVEGVIYLQISRPRSRSARRGARRSLPWRRPGCRFMNMRPAV
jgi:crossover junction endodeoxyribonuclease RuvC